MGSFLGSAPSGPLQSGVGGTLLVKSDQDLVEEALLSLLKTVKGERVMRSTFGSGAERFIFGNVDNVTLRALEQVIIIAISEMERIESVVVEASYVGTQSPKRIDVKIEYKIASINRTGNLVYPFIVEG